MRRLRENTMLEAEISANGDVLVEGHPVGELQGFRFTADQSADGEDAKAVRGAAQKALAAEFESRAERFAAAANGDFALGSDGLMRWIGTPVATLAASGDVLRPRIILLADEQLSGAARDKVVQRAERYVNYQIETLLKPLFDLAGAEQLTGLARGIAFRLVENLGLIERRLVSEDLRSLDQEARAALRRLGVRFGAYHVFVPALLKPGPAGMATLVWSLANDARERPGFGDVVHALASGRTSLVVDPTFDPAFYRLAGFRLLGRRAVRVDILERLADLIRPALAWRVGTGSRPEGAFDGNAFLVTPAMMSILGATGDDMEDILKSLGYRSEAKPAAELRERLAALDAAAQPVAADPQPEQPQTEQAEPEAATAEQAEAEEQASEPAAQEAAEATVSEAASLEEAPEQVHEASEPAADAPAEDAAVQVPLADAEAPVGTVQAEAGPEAAEEEKPVLLWRPQRSDQRQRNAGRRGGERHQKGRADAGGGGRNEEGQAERRGRGGQRPGQKGQRRHGGEADAQRRGEDKRPQHKGAQHRGGEQKGAQQKGGEQRRAREERPARIDPDSPFAKLAALRDQLRK